MIEITGKILEYEHENGDRYKLLFGIKTVTWECLAGSASGLSGTNSYDAIEITPSILFISWSMDDGKVVGIIVNLQNDIIHCCFSHEGKRQFIKGNIKRFTKAPIDRF